MSVRCISSCSARLTRMLARPAGIAPGGVYLLDWHLVPEDHRNLLFAASHVVLSGNRGSLQRQLAGTGALVRPSGRSCLRRSQSEEPSSPLPFLELPYFNGLGGFTADGREYAIYLAPGHGHAGALDQCHGEPGIRQPW